MLDTSALGTPALKEELSSVEMLRQNNENQNYIISTSGHTRILPL
jgi:hypothetical protein